MGTQHFNRAAGGLLVVLLVVNLGCAPTAAGPTSFAERSTSGSVLSQPDSRIVLRDSAAFLWSKQGTDGGWHSETYGLLKSGQALTPFVLHALLAVPTEIHAPPPDGIARAVEFIRQHVDQRGVLGVADPDVLEYPNYSTAYALRCLLRAGDAGDRELIARMTAYLAAEQFDADRGFAASSPAYGGWGFGGVHAAGETGHMDLAHARRILQALRAAGETDHALFEQAEAFLRFVQKHPDDPRPQPQIGAAALPTDARHYDGGFFFSPIVLHANKGRIDQQTDQFRSYATATCDGILALLAAGVSSADERVESARQWLANFPDWNYPAGIPTDHPEPWGQAVFFYYLAVRSETYRALNWKGEWSLELVRILAREQAADGSFKNTHSPLMKEDDPLLSTSLAVIALEQIHVGEHGVE